MCWNTIAMLVGIERVLALWTTCSHFLEQVSYVGISCVSFYTSFDAVGTDGVVRYWSVESGKLLYYFKPQTQSQPVVAYTDTLLEKPNTPSLLIADGGSIRVYRN